MNNNSPSFYYSNYLSDKSETYRKLEQLSNDVRNSWTNDCDETDSMKEIIEMINGMLVMTSLEDYFLNDKMDLEFFMGEFSKDVLSNILAQPVIYGENGDQIGLDLIYHYIKLFMKFHKKKEYSNLFENIRKIFSKPNSNQFFNPRAHSFKKEINKKKKFKYDKFNDEYCKDFKKDTINDETFKIGDKVDILIRYEKSKTSLDQNAWVRGIITDIIDNEYIIEYPNDSTKNIRTNVPIDSPNILKEGTKTEDWEWRLSLKENDLVDCYDRCKWFPGTICKVTEYKNENGLIYKDYRVGFRLYPDNCVENSEYDYTTFLQYTIFWDNPDNVLDQNGNSYFGDSENFDETLAFFSKKIQKFQKFTSIQKESLNNQYTNLLSSYNNNLNNDNINVINSLHDRSDGDERVKIMTDFLENDNNEKKIEDMYVYEKDGQKNYIIGKEDDNFCYYFAQLLKKLADDGEFENMINILKDKPTVDELYTIFFILMNSSSYIHNEFFKENFDIFKNSYYEVMNNLSSKEMRTSQKEMEDLAGNFFIKINYLISPNENSQKVYMDEIRLTLSLNMIKSSIFDKKIQGVKTIGEYIKNITDEEGKKNIINLIKKYEIIKELFGTNYHTQIISKSNEILELLLKNNELSEEDLKLIWSLTEQGDLEAKMIIYKLISDLIIYFNDTHCNLILELMKNDKNKKLNENEIDLIYNLAIKGNNENMLLQCCEFYTQNILEINKLNNLEKCQYMGRVINIFSKGEKYCNIMIDMCENNLKCYKNVLAVYFLLEKIIEKYKNNIIIENSNNLINEENTDNSNDFINKAIHKMIDNEKLLNLFKDNFLSYKKKAKENIKENQKEKDLIIDGYTHEDNMKNRVLFLIKIIPILYPKFDFFELLKDICLHEPAFQSDKLLFYDFMKKFITESSKNISSINSKEQKILIETQLFNMLTEENKSELTLSQFNLYIEIFYDINKEKGLLLYDKNKNDEYIIDINNDTNIEDVFGIDNLWNLLFDLNKKDLTEKLINIIYNLYSNKDETQKLLNKCVNIIKDIENITYNKLDKCINILKYIILESEKNGYIDIKPHFNLLKDCIINLPSEIKKNKKNNNDLVNYYMKANKENENNDNYSKNLLFGNTSLIELKKLLVEKKNLLENNLTISFYYKENKTYKTKLLDSSYNNKSLKEILNIDIEKQNKNIFSLNKLIFTGEKIKKQPLVEYGQINQKFEKMIKSWFYYFSHGNEIMEKDNVVNFISCMNPDKNIDENSSEFRRFMHYYDEGEKDFIVEEEFIKYYNDLAQMEPSVVWENIKIMKYGIDFEKIIESNNNNEKINKDTLPRYILGNDQQFHDALIRLYSKYETKMPIYEFIFFLCTNENKYNKLLQDFKIFFNEENNNNNINYLEQLYELFIIESFIQDLEVMQLDLKEIFKEKINNSYITNHNEANSYKVLSKDYMPFDNDDNLNKKKLFLFNFIENQGYEKLIKYVENLLDSINNNNNIDDEKIKFKCCKIGINLINIIYNSFIEKEKETNKENNNKIDIYYLNNSININKINKPDNNEDENNDNNENKINKLKEIVLNTNHLDLVKKLISFLIKYNYDLNDTLCSYCFNLLIILLTNNESLSVEIKKNEEIKNSFSNLIKKGTNSTTNHDKFFIQSLIKYISNLSNSTITINKLTNEFLLFLFEILNVLFKELVNNNQNKEKSDNKENCKSFSLFFELFSNLFKIILNNNNIYNKINENLNDQFISQIYELLYKDIKEENIDKKLKEETFLGFMKILITAIKNNSSIKSEIISKKINDETLFDIIYKRITNLSQTNNKDNIDIDIILSNINENNPEKYIQMNKLNEFVKNLIDSNKKNGNNETISQEVYDIYNNFILTCFRNSTNPEIISLILNTISNENNKINYQLIKPKSEKIPKKFGYVGLKNIGCICYLNSILQQMYNVPSFRYAIMSADDKKESNIQMSFFHNNHYDDNLLHQLQKMYTFLTYSEKQAYNPKDFCASFKDFDGAPINPLIQQDSQEFFNNFCDKIENSLKDTKYKYIIDNIFTGKTCSSVICEECNNVSNRFEDFYNLTLEVKNIGSLYESLEKLIVPEKIEQFNCEKCKKKVTISKRSSLSKLPNVLFVHLKRFYMNYEIERTEKINSKFEFPNTLNLKKYCIEEINKKNNNDNSYETEEIYPKEDEYYEYELKGINVHLGNAQGGHYISFIDIERDGHDNELNIKSSIENNVFKSKWLKFNDSIITEFDTNDIPIESYGGSVDYNSNNENIQNAYLLIYERKKKTPIKIIIDKNDVNYFNNQDKYLYNNNIITFGKEQKASINKFYDISYLNKEVRVKEEELYKMVFCDEEKNEYYVFIPYYNIEKKVLKKYFIEVMKKNMNFLNRKILPNTNPHFKDECNEILFDIIKDSNILNYKFSLFDKMKIISFFKEQIFEDKIIKNETVIISEEQKLIFNNRANILLKKLILPIVNNENKDKDYDFIINHIFNFLLSNNILEKIFESRYLNRVFDNKNIKIFCEIIYTTMNHIYKRINIKNYFFKIYGLKDSINEYSSQLIYNNNDEDDDDNNKNDKSPLYNLYELIYKIIILDYEFVELLIPQQPVSDLLCKINEINSKDIRKIIYDIILIIINNSYEYTRKKNGNNILNNMEIDRIFKCFNNSKKLLKILFNEKNELLIKLIKIIQYNNFEDTEKFNKVLAQYLFSYAAKNNILINMLDLLYEIINIQDKYVLDRLYVIMGFPEIILKHQIKDNSEDEEDNDEKENEIEKKDNKFFPLFGYRLYENSKNGEVFKYVNNIKIFESHCILAQLFPCSNDELYTNFEIIKNDQKLTDEERNNYIYKLLCISLLNEGNYALFKYIYLTQSRFIIKYNNLYEEIIDILSKDNKYDLTEIKKNAEMCIKRINYEVNKIKDNLLLISNKNLDADDDINDDIKVKENQKYIDDNDEIPDLPEKMKYKENEDVEQFTGFNPKHLPDEIEKVVYSIRGHSDNILLICVKYYTTFQDVESIRQEKNKKENDDKKNGNNEEENIKKEEEEENKKHKIKMNDSDDEMQNIDLSHNEEDNTYDVNKIKINENIFFKNLFNHLREKRKIIIKDKIFKSKKKTKLSVIRYVLISNVHRTLMLNIENISNNFSEIERNNLYTPRFFLGYIKSIKYCDLITVYRRNKILDFINENSLNINIKVKAKDNKSFEKYLNWSDIDD